MPVAAEVADSAMWADGRTAGLLACDTRQLPAMGDAQGDEVVVLDAQFPGNAVDLALFSQRDRLVGGGHRPALKRPAITVLGHGRAEA